MLPKLTFVLGGAASGKSVWAENYLLSSRLDPVYLATSRAFDDEIKSRIKVHQSRRSDQWRTLEHETDLGPGLQTVAESEAVLIDCATMWLTNHLMDDSDTSRARSGLLSDIAACRGPVVVVSNEVGHGIVPENALARHFRDLQGRLNIALAEQADVVVLVTAGLPQVLKGQLP
ncbi:bifunctional adenosylcobinamide kinase/adenosylcobinamide-phosphate guanylyltransferase [Roseobacter ponti]|uniref:Bifunctional adenosylcobalamin biosynthesis protein n=1 Tax=Roseobacter ponti TaxID=1891787 RepID=A0A858SQU0_9RHOB|nr:bifunctional adenosylcobinamide kinase/adenosylcobinamide-phosphate guanylyltransferase [Roseobacter ponti]QJF50043.1 bifunctional adenosylcobinamide kinase/adenosylcobinamide-phosphate guanylyltransferase [Roseobacter ponti]